MATPQPRSRELAGVDEQEKRDSEGHTGDPGGDGKYRPTPFTQFSHVELAAGFQAHDEEEE